jgi:LmbE family N-acetylglucosaminyl deacetylase
MRVLAVGAHPDDLEILCAGTLARFARAGHEVVMCHATLGNRGSYVHSAEEIGRIRLQEARRAAAVIGARHETLGLPDAEVSGEDPAQRRLMVDLVRRTRPDVILTHWPSDYLSDHNHVSKLVFDASFAATLPLFETEHPSHDRVTPLLYFEPLMGLGFQPQEYVDVTEVIDLKTEMLEAHQSQLRWLRDHDGVDIVEQMRAVARFRGLQSGVDFAEGFVQCRTWLRGTTRRLLP